MINVNIKYSIVVSIYNIEKYISKCVDSIIHQSYKNIEVLLIDDGSKDSSSNICDSYASKDDRIKVIHKQNAGLGLARNTGLENATGDYILFIDGDDFVDLNLIDTVNKYLTNKEYDIVCYDSYDYYNNDKIISVDTNNQVREYNDNEILGYVLPHMIYDIENNTRFQYCAWNKVYRLELLKQTNFKFISERQYISEDFYSNLLLYKDVKSFLALPDKLYYYRKNNLTSLTSTYRSDRLEKNNYQYFESIKIAKEYKYNNLILNNIGFQYFNNMLGTFEMIFNCSLLKNKEKKKNIYNIIKDENFNYIINQLKLSREPLYKKVLVYCLKHKFSRFSYFMLKIKNNIKKINEK